MLHPTISVTTYFSKVEDLFLEKGNPEIAQGQMKYLRNLFEYYGLKAPVWTAIAKELFKTEGIYDGENLKAFVRTCYDTTYRELHYFAIQMLEKRLKKQPKDFIWFLEELLTTNSWWDTVDWLSKLAGIHFQRFPELLQPTTEKWIATDNIWLQRTAIICQRFYKQKTNTDLLFDYILRTADSKEFFIEKGAGWALRDYSKVNPEAVVQFINENPHLPNLTKREGLKWLKKNGLL